MGKRIGILTGGGDVPGLNPCIRAVVYRAADDGDEVVGIRRGWAGLLNFDLDNESSIMSPIFLGRLLRGSPAGITWISLHTF
jgi:6-phosphofructokinase